VGWEVVVRVRVWLLLTIAVVSRAESGPVAAIRAEMDKQVEAWNRGDVKAFMESYDRSDSILFVGRSVTRGYQPVLESYIKRYPTREHMGKLTFTDLEVTILSKEYAFVLGKFNLARTVAGGGDASGWFTLLFKKTGKAWKIVADHTS